MKYIRKSWLIALVLILSACGASSSDGDGKKKDVLEVHTTVYPLEDFTKRIGGDHVKVESVYPPGSDEHSYEPSQKDMIDMADGDVFFYIGLGLEGFVDKSKSILENEDVKVVATSEGIDLESHEGHDHDAHEEGEDHEEEGHDHGDDGHHHGDTDPHIWLDPGYAQQIAQNIADTLSAEMPEHKDEFQSNLKDLDADLKKLDEDFHEMADAAPKKTFFVSHAAYNYWAERYGLNQKSIAGLNTSDEPSQKELKAIIDQGKKENIQYIMFEQNVSSRLTEVVQKELGAEALTLHNLAVLTPEDEKNKEDYFSLMNRNIDTLKKALY
ncbi:metal ABC transporter solute-binding protein, Zn/Mn family [Rossellomorea marisflavi]|uniref:metal ABC transporter solute-binding protein, Zn/Mn family n=1 Tax=Rossellomorea marisflavi TaxID=189381 RepID=UPI0006A9DC6A|nr:zinc ABC transporter substrate-binding protein [Rossellomorea marisflavi]